MKAKSAAAPFGIWMSIFTLVPMAIVVYFAFTNEAGQFTFENIFHIQKYLVSLWDSIKLGAIATAICLILAYPLAFIIARAAEKVQQTMVMIIMIPMWMNFLLRTYAWMSILEDNGFLNQFFGLFGLHFNMMYTSGAIILGMVYNFLPFMVLPIYSVMAKMDNRIIEAAEDLGCNYWHVFLRIILPLSKPGIFSGITMVFVPAVSTFVITQLLGGGKNYMIGDIIEFMFIGSGDANYNVGAALSLVLMVLMLLCMAVMSVADKDADENGIGGMLS